MNLPQATPELTVANHYNVRQEGMELSFNFCAHGAFTSDDALAANAAKVTNVERLGNDDEICGQSPHQDLGILYCCPDGTRAHGEPRGR